MIRTDKAGGILITDFPVKRTNRSTRRFLNLNKDTPSFFKRKFGFFIFARCLGKIGRVYSPVIIFLKITLKQLTKKMISGKMILAVMLSWAYYALFEAKIPQKDGSRLNLLSLNCIRAIFKKYSKIFTRRSTNAYY